MLLKPFKKPPLAGGRCDRLPKMMPQLIEKYLRICKYMKDTRFPKDRTAAAIDLGSQTFRLAIAQVLEDRAQLLASERKNVRLGQGLAVSGRLSEEAMRRGIETLRAFHKVLDRFGTRNVRACGTAALRSASNSREFLDLAEAEGFHVEILSGEEEASISAMGVCATLPGIDRPFLVIDVGGGSSELVLAGSRGILYSQSLNMGAVNLTEEFLRADPPSSEELERLGSYIRQRLSGLPARFPRSPRTIVGVGGTATTLVAIALAMVKYEPRRIRGYTLNFRELEGLWNYLTGMKIQVRRGISGLESKRADIILAGIAIFREILHIIKSRELTVSDGGFLLGLLSTLIEKEPGNCAKLSHTRGLYL